MRRFRSASLAALVLTALASASVATATPASAAKAKKPATITVLVTNDDGVAAPGIDTLVEALRKQKNTKVVVVAPDSNKSGSGGKTTPGHAHHVGGDHRQRLRGHRRRRLPCRHDHRRARPARREAQRGAVGHQRGSEPRWRGRPLGHRRRRPRRRSSRHPGAGGEPGPRRRAAVRQRGEARGRRGWPSTAPSSRRSPSRLRSPRSTTTTSRTAPRARSGASRRYELATTSDGAIADVDCASAVTSPTNDIEAFNAGWASYTKVPTTPATPAS